MKNIKLIFLSLAIALTISSSIFAQSTVDTIFGVPVNELYRGNIEIPSDIKIPSAKFFNIASESLHNTTINLFDENQVLLWKVILTENTSTKTIDYKIFDSNSNLQWFKVVKTVENNKDVANATSSSGKTMKITTSKGNIATNCPTKTPVADIEIIVNNEAPKSISSADMQTQKGISNLPGLIQQAEEKFFDTEQLKVLQNVVFVSDSLQSLIMERSNITIEAQQSLPGPPKCSVFCVRTGAILPVYYCNSATLNCGRCGVSGAFVLSSWGCFWFCTIPCGDFWA